jgi:hypothetical protein
LLMEKGKLRPAGFKLPFKIFGCLHSQCRYGVTVSFYSSCADRVLSEVLLLRIKSKQRIRNDVNWY